jgi:hypothetical protein
MCHINTVSAECLTNPTDAEAIGWLPRRKTT